MFYYNSTTSPTTYVSYSTTLVLTQRKTTTVLHALCTCTTSDVTDMFRPCTKWRTIFTPVGLFQTLNAALSAIEFAKRKHSAMLKKVKTAYLAEKP